MESYIKISQRHIHDIHQRQGNHIITVIQIDSGGTEDPQVHVINFSTEKTWQYPRKSVDIATSKCFLFRGNYFVAIATTPNLRRKSDDPFRRYSHALYKGF